MGDRLKKKAAIVTGAGSVGEGLGNGRAVALMFARHGAELLLVDRDPDALDRTRAMLNAESLTAEVLVADVANADDCRSISETCIDRYGRIDVLHNNVGIERPGGLEATTLDDWDTTMRTNVTSIYLMCREVVPKMVDSGGGSVVSISSINAIRTLPALSLAYAASKAAVIALMREIAIEYASQNVRANSILPGMMLTPFVAASLTEAYGNDVDEMMRMRDALCPTGSQGSAWDVAHMAVFLASDESRYVTGEALVVDGGQTSWLTPTRR